MELGVPKKPELCYSPGMNYTIWIDNTSSVWDDAIKLSLLVVFILLIVGLGVFAKKAVAGITVLALTCVAMLGGLSYMSIKNAEVHDTETPKLLSMWVSQTLKLDITQEQALELLRNERSKGTDTDEVVLVKGYDDSSYYVQLLPVAGQSKAYTLVEIVPVR